LGYLTWYYVYHICTHTPYIEISLSYLWNLYHFFEKNVYRRKFMLSCIWITSREGLQWMHFQGKLLLGLYFSIFFACAFHSNKVLPYYMFLVSHMKYRYFGQLLWFSIISLNYRGVLLATHYGFFSASLMPAPTQLLTYHLAN
jgi:hypothetical protein